MAKSTLKPLPLRVTEAELIEIDKLAAEYAGNNRKNLIMMALNDFKEKRGLLNHDLTEVKKEIDDLKKEIQSLKNKLNYIKGK
jgi:uncharacterized coiled-coil DUF342 family protein